MMILSVIAGLFMLLRRVRNKKDDEESESEEQAESRTDDEKNRKYQKRKLAVIAAVVLAVASVIVFFITEDLTNSMALVDRYTLIMAAMLIGSVISVVFGKKKADGDEEPEGQKN